MKRKKIGWVLGVMVLAIVLVVPSVSRSLAVDLSNTYPLSFAMMPDFEEDLSTVGVDIDLFKVADAVEMDGYDAYSFEAVGAFEGLSGPLSGAAAGDPDGANYAALGQMAGQIVADNNVEAIDTVSSSSTADLMPGLYLAMPHKRGVALADSIEHTLVDGADGSQTNNVVSVVKTAQNKYEFSPVLVALPSRMGSLGNNTANTGDWTGYRMTLKATSTTRDDGSLVINKNVDRYGGSGEQRFVFEITVVPVEGDSFTRIESIVLEEGATSGSVTVDNIPAGSTVTVEEKYYGTNYTYVSGNGSQVLADADVVLEFNFRNELVENHKHGSSVNNTYVYGEEGGHFENGQGGNE